MRPSIATAALLLLTSTAARADVFHMPPGQTSLETVPVDNLSNANDPATGNLYGGVSYAYRIGTYEVTNAQYTEFLNAKASISDPYGLYTSLMASATQGGITQSGTSSFTYSVKPGFANKPVAYVSWYDAIRFSNWLTNGQESGDTESGTYTITGGGINSGTVAIPNGAQRAAWASTSSLHWLLPSENEWYKAAYYKGGSTNAGYWLYPFRSNTVPTGDVPPGASNSANYYGHNGFAVTQEGAFSAGQVYLTDVGAYTSALSPYGAHDMGGNVDEWNEALLSGSTRGIRGGDFGGPSSTLAASHRNSFNPTIADEGFGFRVASVPEPSSFALAAIGMLVALGWIARRRASR